jgi:hypothetical protein
MAHKIESESINMSEEWITMKEAATRLKVRSNKLSRLASKGVIQTKSNPLDARVTLVNFTELRKLFDEFGPSMSNGTADDSEDH